MPRKALDGAKLAADIDRLEHEDEVSPPAAQPSLMDAVRAFASYIETRAKLGWTDPMIAVVLTNAGYPISAETLRSYRKRLRDEGLMAPISVAGQKAKTRPPTTTATAPLPAIEPSPVTDIVAVEPVAPAPSATVVIPITDDATNARAPPDPRSPPSRTRTYRVDPTKLPPDRA